MAYYKLGSYSCHISTSSAKAQRWFDRGLIWMYGYNFEEAIVCFQKALRKDRHCAMAHWGIAYASGPNYNMPWDRFDAAGRAEALAQAYDATQAALNCAAVSEREEELIIALTARYPQRDVPEDIAEMAGWNDSFADAMREVFDVYPDKLEVRAIFAEALLNRTPWTMWDLASGTPAADASTEECRDVLEEALESDPRAMSHPGLLHLYVHLMEMSPVPELALKAADRLRDLVPDAGHLVHMPTHIDVLCGNYADVVRWNEMAVVADLKYLDREGAFNLYTGYRKHNYHFIIYGAMMLGQMGPAMAAVDGIRDTVPEDLLRIQSPPMADFAEAYFAFEPHVLVRFGLWEEAIDMPLPEDQELFCTLTAHVHYARGVAHAALGQVAEAQAEQLRFREATARVPDTRLLHNNRVIDLLEIADAMLEGEIAYRREAYDAAWKALRRAVALEDGLPYDEPWGWMQPVRHALGALLLEQGHVGEAEAVFREDLGLGGQVSRATVHPDNIWALKGLHDCLAARGETHEIVMIRQKLDIANARADVQAQASCFCAQAAMTA